MSTISPFLKITLQTLDENPDTWGDVLNVSALEVLEDAIAGTATIDVSAAGDYTMDDTAGGPSAADHSRFAIINATGAPGETRNIIVPTRSKIYLVANNTDSDSVVVKTSAGTGVTVLNGEVVWVYCDGTNIVATSTASASAISSAIETAAGAGMTHASGVLNVIGGNGITVTANAIALTDAAVSTTKPVGFASGVPVFDMTSLTQADATDIGGADELLLNDGGALKAVRWQDMGIPQTDDTSTAPFAAADPTYANRWFNCSNASPISVAIPANGVVGYPVGTTFAFHQRGAGQITVSTADTLLAPNGAKTTLQYSTLFVTKIAATEWVVTGDTTS